MSCVFAPCGRLWGIWRPLHGTSNLLLPRLMSPMAHELCLLFWGISYYSSANAGWSVVSTVPHSMTSATLTSSFMCWAGHRWACELMPMIPVHCEAETGGLKARVQSGQFSNLVGICFKVKRRKKAKDSAQCEGPGIMLRTFTITKEKRERKKN